MSILISIGQGGQQLRIQNPDKCGSIQRIRIRPLPASAERLAALYDDAALLFEELCYYFEPSQPYTALPFDLQQEIDERHWCGAIAQLQVKGLIEVEIGGGS